MTIDDISYLDPDTINGLNLYAYCANNPMMYVDPNGNAWWHWLLGAVVVGVAVLSVFAVASAIVTIAGISASVASGIVAGATISAGVARLVNLVGQYSSGVEKPDVLSLAVSVYMGGISGVLSGGIASQGILSAGSIAKGAIVKFGYEFVATKSGQIIANIGISVMNGIISNLFNQTKMDWETIGLTILAGVLAGATYTMQPVQALSIGFFSELMPVVRDYIKDYFE